MDLIIKGETSYEINKPTKLTNYQLIEIGNSICVGFEIHNQPQEDCDSDSGDINDSIGVPVVFEQVDADHIQPDESGVEGHQVWTSEVIDTLSM